MKKKGFTLIELLAVIVILAIIALIATPTILGVIQKSKKASSEASAYGYIDAVEKYIMTNSMDMSKKDINNGIYKDSELEVSYKGKGPDNALITVEKGIVKEAKICISKYSFDYDGKEVTSSVNNYCSNNYKIKLVIDDNIEEKSIEKELSTTFELSNITNKTNIVCNNGAVPTLENNILTISNIFGDTKCKINNTLEDTINNIDNTENNIIMINDEEITNTLIIEENKNVTLDLNGKTLTSSVNTIKNLGTLVIDSSKNFGTISTTGYNTKVLWNTSSTANLTINNGYIKGTENCDTWSCTPIYSTSNSNLEITPLKDNSFDEENRYIDGIYVESYYGINTWVTSSSNAIINGGVYNVVRISDNISWQHLVCSSCESLTINYAKTIGDGSSIRLQGSGKIIVNNGEFYSIRKDSIVADDFSSGIITVNNGLFVSNDYCAVRNAGNSNININSGTFISEKASVIGNTGNGNININQTDKPIYIASLATSDNIYAYKAIVNTSTGNININGSKSDKCDGNINSNTKGICIYSKYRTILSETNATGKININGATIVSDNLWSITNYNGIINILNSDIISNNSSGIVLFKTGRINLCNNVIKSNLNDLYTATTATGKIYHNSSNILNASSIKDETDNNLIIQDNSITCK